MCSSDLVVGDLGPGGAQRGDEGGLAGAGVPHEGDVGDGLELQDDVEAFCFCHIEIKETMPSTASQSFIQNRSPSLGADSRVSPVMEKSPRSDESFPLKR